MTVSVLRVALFTVDYRWVRFGEIAPIAKAKLFTSLSPISRFYKNFCVVNGGDNSILYS